MQSCRGELGPSHLCCIFHLHGLLGESLGLEANNNPIPPSPASSLCGTITFTFCLTWRTGKMVQSSPFCE